jgi:hypothetical protein
MGYCRYDDGRGFPRMTAAGQNIDVDDISRSFGALAGECGEERLVDASGTG